MANWQHQEREFQEGKDQRSRALFWSMRTGKSKAVIDKAEYQFSQGAIDGCVIIAPNGVHLNWVINEIPRWAWDWDHPFKAIAWETPRAGDPEFQKNLHALYAFRGMKWLVVNMEALTNPDCRRAIRLFLNACRRRFMLGISEAHHFGRAGAKRTTKARDLASFAQFVTIETGTPFLNSPLKAYSLFKILTGYLPEHIDTYEKFVKHFAILKDEEAANHRHASIRRRAWRKKKIAGYKNMDELKALLAPVASVVLRSDIEDMPPLLRTERIVAMSEEQRRAYVELASRYLVEIGDDLITAADAGPRMMKLQQILMGYAIDSENHAVVNIDPAAPVYEAIYDEIAGTLPGKTIVWFRYREDIRRMCALLRERGIKTLEYHGGVPTGQRENIRREFQDVSNRTYVLVGQPATGAEGRDFSAASAIIFGSSTPNAIHVAQGEERGTARDGHPVTIVRVRFPGTVDDRNWDIVDGKVTLADSVSGHGLRDLLRTTNV